jgi:hypothetical protein
MQKGSLWLLEVFDDWKNQPITLILSQQNISIYKF